MTHPRRKEIDDEDENVPIMCNPGKISRLSGSCSLKDNARRCRLPKSVNCLYRTLLCTFINAEKCIFLRKELGSKREEQVEQ